MSTMRDTGSRALHCSVFQYSAFPISVAGVRRRIDVSNGVRIDKTGGLGILRGGKGVFEEETGFSVPHARPRGLIAQIGEH
jgi:hypothetical protein